MVSQNPYRIYKTQDIETSNPREIVAKLYSAAVVNLKRAVLDIQNHRLENAHLSIVKAEKIISALDASLDMSYELSGNLHALYRYMLRRMLDGNMKKDIGILNEISGLLVDLRDAWDEARKTARQ